MARRTGRGATSRRETSPAPASGDPVEQAIAAAIQALTGQRTRFAVLAAVFALFIGCTTASVTGEPFGRPFGVASAVSTRSSNDTVSTYAVRIFNQEAANFDTPASGGSQGIFPAGKLVLGVLIAKNGPGFPAVRAEPYLESGSGEWSDIGGTESVNGRYSSVSISDASVTLTNATEELITGTFEGTGAAGQRFSGTFNAPLCFY